MLRRLTLLVGWWRGLDLVRRYLLTSLVVFILGTAIIGNWMARRIEDGVTQNTASATALYVESFIAPQLQHLDGTRSLDAAAQAKLQSLLNETQLGKRIKSLKIWQKGGLVVYASRPEIIGQTFQPTPKLRKAWSGVVAAELDNLIEEEHQGERAYGVPLLEVYAPIRKQFSDKVIAVAEFYESADRLRADLFKAKLESWLIVGSVVTAAMLALWSHVARAGRTIVDQQKSLEDRITQLSHLLDQNKALRHRIARSSERAAVVNERYLQRLGAELHDGPAQLLSLALLRVGSGARSRSSCKGSSEADDASEQELVRRVLNDALTDIRNLCAGLSLPELESISLRQSLESAVSMHKARTGTAVTTSFGDLPDNASHLLKATAYRVVQEGLNNSTRHAGAIDQKVKASLRDDVLVVEVSDGGEGFDVNRAAEKGRLGHAGLRERLESIGGSLRIESLPGRGTRLLASMPMRNALYADV